MEASNNSESDNSSTIIGGLNKLLNTSQSSIIGGTNNFIGTASNCKYFRWCW